MQPNNAEQEEIPWHSKAKHRPSIHLGDKTALHQKGLVIFTAAKMGSTKSDLDHNRCNIRTCTLATSGMKKL